METGGFFRHCVIMNIKKSRGAGFLFMRCGD